MLGSQYEFQHDMDAHNITVKVLLHHAHNLISGSDLHQRMEPDAAHTLLGLLGYKKVADAKPM